MRSDGNGNGSRRPQEIQAEIERTRREMDGTLHAIEERLTPGQLFDQGLSYLKNSGGAEFVANLGEQAKRNPMPVALVGVGLAWLMATQKAGAGPATQPDSGLKQKAYETRARLGESAAAIGERAAAMRDSTRQQIDRARNGLDTMMREQPLALGAIGLAIGALAAALAPRTRYEDRVVEKAAEAVAASPQDKPPDATQRARAEERDRLQQAVTPFAERAQNEPPV